MCIRDSIEVELDKIRPMIALPFHPSNAYTIQEFQENMDELLHQVDEDTVRQLKLKKMCIRDRSLPCWTAPRRCWGCCAATKKAPSGVRFPAGRMSGCSR